jgi:hypothetical protein
MNKGVEKVLQVASDLSTAGVVGGIIALTNSCPEGLQTLMMMSIPALGCAFNFGDRAYNERIAQKEKEKFEKILSDIKDEMKTRGLEDLQRFINLDLSTEEYATIESLIKSGLNAKNTWTRKLIASILVTTGCMEIGNQSGFERCAVILEELDVLDVQLLLLLMLYANIIAEGEEAHKQIDDINLQLINDDNIYSQSIMSSSIKLKALGLISNSGSLHPHDDEINGNKKEMIEDFINQNTHELTAHLLLFINFITGTFKP